MDSKIMLESFLSAIDIGAVFESVNNYRKRTWELDVREILKHMITGKGYINLTPPQTSHLIFNNQDRIIIVDLRDVRAYGKKHIDGSLSKPIDDFLKEIYEGSFSAPSNNSKIVLVCDTGKLSKVAASIMIENGFTEVYSIKGGMRRWNRWVALSQKAIFAKIASCCTQIPT